MLVTAVITKAEALGRYVGIYIVKMPYAVHIFKSKVNLLFFGKIDKPFYAVKPNR